MRTEGRFFALLLGFALITDYCVAVSSPNSKTPSPQSPDLCLARTGSSDVVLVPGKHRGRLVADRIVMLPKSVGIADVTG